MSEFNLFPPPPQNRYFLLGSALQLHFNPFPASALSPPIPDIMGMTREYFRRRMLDPFQLGFDQSRFNNAFNTLTGFTSRGRTLRANATVFDCFGAASRHAQETNAPTSENATLSDVVGAIRRDTAFIQCIDDIRMRTTGLMDSVLSSLPQRENLQEGLTRTTISETLPGWGTMARTGVSALRTALGRLGDPGPVIALLATNELSVSVPGLAGTSVKFEFDDTHVTTTITTRPLAIIREFWSTALPPTVRDQIFTITVSGQSSLSPPLSGPNITQGMITLDVTALIRSATGQR